MQRRTKIRTWLVCLLPLLALGLTRLTTPPWTHYDASHRVTFASDSAYTRDEYDWWVSNSGDPSSLYYDNTYLEQETGSWSLNLPVAWRWQRDATGVKVGLIDLNGQHAAMAIDLIYKVAPGVTVTLYPVSRYYGDVVGTAMALAVADGNRIVVLTTGYSTPEPDVLNACELALAADAAVVCALPNGLWSVDENPDYPTSFRLPNVLSVASLDRNGDHYWSYYGTNVVAAPGRNIMAAGVYSSGTSYATPIVAGVLALLVKRHPEATAADLVNHIRNTADQLQLVKRLNAVNAITHAL